MKSVSAALFALAAVATAGPVKRDGPHGHGSMNMGGMAGMKMDAPKAAPKMDMSGHAGMKMDPPKGSSMGSMAGHGDMSGHGSMGGMGGGMGGMNMGGGGMNMGGGGMPMGGLTMQKGLVEKPVVKEIPALFSTPEIPTKRVQIRYGPYIMAAANDTTLMPMHGMEDEGGVVDVKWDIGEAVKPCSNCVLRHANASISYDDFSPANLDTGAWLHHITLAAVGPGRADIACPGVKNQGMGIIGGDRERFMVVHNDRNATFWGSGSDKAGYELKDSDKLNMVLELKNERNVQKKVYLYMDFEFAPGPLPSGWLDIKPVWLDAQGCGELSSEIHPPKDKQQFSLKSTGWTAPWDAELVSTVGHMHDGGEIFKIFVNGKPVCESHPVYGGDAAYAPTKETIALGAQNMVHISRYTPCNSFGSVKKGDVLTVQGDYDFKKYQPALGNSGAPVGVMSLALTMFGVKKA